MKTTDRKFSSFGRSGALVLFVLLSSVWSPPSLAQTRSDWKDRWNKVLAEAKKERKVVVWGPPGDLIREAIVGGFKKASPDITIEYAAARAPEQAAKIRAERDGGIYSVDVLLQGTTTALTYFKPMGALEPIKPALILPEVTELKSWRNHRLEFSDANEHNLVFASSVKTPVIYNLDQVRVEEVDELHELLSPKWKGKIVINDPLPSGGANVTFRFIWKALGPEKATDYYRKIRAQAGIVDRDERREIEWVAQGRYAILLGPSDRMIPEFLQRGLKFGVLPEFKDHGTLLTPGPSSIILLSKAPHPNSAAVFVNWLLGKEGQTGWSKASGYASHRLDVPTEHLPPYGLPRPGGKYWLSYTEKEIERSPDEEKILKELFGR